MVVIIIGNVELFYIKSVCSLRKTVRRSPQFAWKSIFFMNMYLNSFRILDICINCNITLLEKIRKNIAFFEVAKKVNFFGYTNCKLLQTSLYDKSKC